MGTAMVWLNGWGMSDDAWCGLPGCFSGVRHVFPRLADAVHEEDFIERTREALAAAEEERVIAVGWSLGGMLALRLAAGQRLHGLVLISSTARFVRPREEADKGWADVYLRRMQAALGEERERVWTEFRRTLFTAEERAAGAEGRIPSGSSWSSEALVAGLSLLRTLDLRPLLPHIRVPTVVIHGTSDTVCPYPAAEELAAGIPGARLVPLDGSGHAPFAVRLDEVAEAIRRGVDGLA